ncbi:MAG TPA: acetyl-CoA hydrolase/transferase family protein [Mogibacterium sp.]|nr:acetyl-CoA hydrolase/transferase family protein [Mogibacterium sp.]
MTWHDEYKKKTVSNSFIAEKIESGDYISLGLCLGGVTDHLVNEILSRHEELQNVTIADAVSVWPSNLNDIRCLKSIRGKINYETFFCMNNSRKILKERLGDFIPCTASDSAGKVLSRSDVFMLMVTPPNDEGYVNLGVTNFYQLDVIRSRKENGIRLLIGEVNDKLPTVHGDNWVHISEFDYFVENSTPMIEFPKAVPNEQEALIADYVLELIKDGDTLQLGIGGIPDAVATGLSSKKNLSIFTEMLPNTLPELVKKGIVTNSNSIFKKGVTIGSFGMGDSNFYEFLNDNPLVELYPSSLIVNPLTIAKQPDMKAINNALLVDLTGQICSEGIGHRQISGAGGQPDFHIGAYHAKGGMACTLLTSGRYLADGSFSSSIVAELPPGTPVTVGRNFADTVITEHGIAELRNKSRRERAEALIRIAHPSCREELTFIAKGLF